MKKLSSYCFIVVSLALAWTARAANTHGTVLHHHPVFMPDKVTTKYTLKDFNNQAEVGEVTVEWNAFEDSASARGANPKQFDKLKYTVKITRIPSSTVPAAAGATYSLVTLGLQSPRHSIKITNATKGVTVLTDPKVSTQFKSPIGEVVYPLTVVANEVDVDEVGFLKFEDAATLECTLEVEAVARYVFGPTLWYKGSGSPGNGHFNEPPENPPR